tara:strand:+ start:2082 stop:2375 length:294 start_codon:yes stop_codon:yes gene_type:complete
MKFSKGDLIFDPRINMTGMIKDIEEKTVDRMNVPVPMLWYKVMLFGDSWCAKGNTRDYAVLSADLMLEAYNEEEHKGLTRDEAEHDLDDISKVFLDL